MKLEPVQPAPTAKRKPLKLRSLKPLKDKTSLPPIDWTCSRPQVTPETEAAAVETKTEAILPTTRVLPFKEYKKWLSGLRREDSKGNAIK